LCMEKLLSFVCWVWILLLLWKNSFCFDYCSLSFTVLGLELRAYTLNHSTSTFMWRMFSRVWWTICLGWLWTLILLISASWVARIIIVSHRNPSWLLFSIKIFGFLDAIQIPAKS
jgi:hypothetical protein